MLSPNPVNDTFGVLLTAQQCIDIVNRVRLGIGGGAFGVRGGISTRGVGVGVGPFSAGTSWRRRRRSGGSGGFVAWLFVAGLVAFVVAWPYLLGTYVAVQAGAWNPSTGRFVVGWCFEVVYIAGLVGWLLVARGKSAQRSDREARRIAELTASGAVYESRQGRSVVYRHGVCNVDHRSRGAAASCRKPLPNEQAIPLESPPVSDDSLASTRATYKLACGWASSILVVGLVVGLGVLIADPIHSSAKDASSKPCPMQTSTGGNSANITMPDIVGQNAGGVEVRLKGLGLNTVELSSANPDYKSVWVASNWTVVGTDPAAGCVIGPSTRITVYVTK
jgi:hypothetical protein